jgi:hypothetical protein
MREVGESEDGPIRVTTAVFALTGVSMGAVVKLQIVAANGVGDAASNEVIQLQTV